MSQRVREHIYRHRFLYGYLLTLTLVYHAWFFNYSIRTHGDWMFLHKEALTSLRAHYFSLWLSDYSFGRVLLDVGQAPTYAAYGFLAKFLGLGFAFGERVVHMWPAVLVAPAGAYFLSLHLVKNKHAALVGAIVYSSNTYALILQTGHLTLAVAYGLLPWALLYFIRTIERKSLRDAIICAIALGLCGAYEPRAAYITLAVLFFFALFKIVLEAVRSRDLREILRHSAFAFLPIAIYGLLSLYWVLGLMKVDSLLDDSVLSRGLFGNAFQSLPAAFTLQHPFWNFSQPIPFVVNDVPIYFWLIPVFAFCGFYLSRNNPKIAFFGLLALVGVLLGKQVDAPFHGLYGWLFANVPGFNAFREASKFYFITALAYSVLIAAFANWLVKNRATLNLSKLRLRYVPPVAVLMLILPFLPNLYVVATNRLGTTFAERSIPKDYETFRQFVLNQKDYYRILWLPRDSRWSVQTVQHPRVDGPTVTEGDWKGLLDSDRLQSRASALAEPLMKNFSNDLLDQSSIKYVVVPPRDSMNDDDFYVHYGHERQAYIDELDKLSYLKRINNSDDGLAIYENSGFRSLASARSNVVQVQSTSQFESAYLLQESMRNAENFNFVVGDIDKSIPRQQVVDPFSGLSEESVSKGKVSQSSFDLNGKGASLFKLINTKELVYTVVSGELQVGYVQRGNLFNHNEPAAPTTEADVGSEAVSMEKDYNYYIKSKDRLDYVDVRDVKNRNLGVTQGQASIIRTKKANLLRNPSFEISADEPVAENCSSEVSADSPTISTSYKEYSDGKKSLMMAASKLPACHVLQKLKVDLASEVVTSFDYKVLSGKQAGIEFRFNDPQNTVMKTDLMAASQEWSRWSQSIKIPPRSTELTIVLKAYPDNRNLTQPSAYFDKAYVAISEPVKDIPSTPKDGYTQLASRLVNNAHLEYVDKRITGKNLISNPSVESGLWKKNVGDCDAYDDKPELGMRINRTHKSDREQSLELSAARHVACTGPLPVEVDENEYYLMSFDYQATTGKGAGYNIAFNDMAQSTIGGQLTPKNSEWTSFKKVIKVPQGAKSLSIAVYAHSQADGPPTVVRYDNFKLVKAANLQSTYVQFLDSAVETSAPKSVDASIVSPSQRNINIEHASKPFYLVLSEKYHPQWSLVASSASGLSAIRPGAYKLAVPETSHFKLNNFLNAWYVDPRVVCENVPNNCLKQPDGSYDIELVAEFTPQRWMNVGMLISGSSFIICLAIILYTMPSRIERRRKKYRLTNTLRR